jgi:L-lysine exporter family protein LysE/ArgO
MLRDRPDLALALNALGTGFLIWCGVRTLLNAGVGHRAIDGINPRSSLRSAVTSMLLVTWLNPLVFLEVGLIAGALSLGFHGVSKWAFAAGFLAASAMRFYGWSLLGQRLSPWLAQGDRMLQFNRGAGAVLLVIATLMAWRSLVTLSGAAVP